MLAASAAIALSACSPAPSPAPIVAATEPGASPTATSSAASPVPSPTEIAANPEDCPKPDEPISYAAFQRYPDGDCFPAGVTVDGWWHTDDDGAIVVGRRPGSVDARARGTTRLNVSLRSGATLPAPSGYGRFSTRTISESTELGIGLAEAEVTALANPATTCPGTGPVPVKVFMDSLTSCWKPGIDIRISGWRDTLDGLCGCGPMFYDEKPQWLTGPDGFGWLFPEPYALNLDDYFTLFAPKPKTLGADSGRRPTYMVVTGHFGDDAAASCRAVADPDAPRSEAPTRRELARITADLRIACAERFVATSIREVAAPESALAFCPAADPLTSDVVWAWGPPHLLSDVCSPGGELSIRGWFDADTSAAGEQPSVKPAWLDSLGTTTLWSLEGGTWDNDHGVELFVNPDTDVVLPASPGWYTVTGHFDDPAAATCVRTDGANAGAPWVDECRNQFVVTGVAPG